MIPRIEFPDHSHILGIYCSPQQKIEEGLEYLRIGFEENNEAILMLTDELTKDEIRDAIMKKWNISTSNDLASLERDGIINIKTSEIYFLQEIKDKDKIIKQFSELASKSIGNGKRGLRVFADLSIFFEKGYEKQIIEYEKLFSHLYEFPVIAFCAYDLNDFQKLDHKSRKILFDHHILHLTNNLYSSIFNIFNNDTVVPIQHICMYYEDDLSQSFVPSSSISSSSTPIIPDSIIRYLDEGLQQNQLCIYLSIYNMKKDHKKNITSHLSYKDSSSIYDNLMVILNSDNYYINAACENLSLFENLKKLIIEKVILNNKKNIRIVCDIPNLLFQNRHFDQCIVLEEWWDQTIENLNNNHGCNVSLICLYNRNNFQKIPFKFHRDRINENHSIICDKNGIIYSKYSELDSLIENRGKEGGKRENEK